MIRVLPLLLLGFAWADDDEDEEHERREHGERGERGEGGERRAPAAPPDPQYVSECGSCHVAYPAVLLPTRSWVAIMNGLGDHFGDNAELDALTRASVTAYLTSHASDVDPRGRRLAASIPATDTPLRITETRWFKGEHDEIPARLVTGNAEVKTWAACSACHPDAAQSRFGEHDVRIPGAGRWED